MLAVASVVLLLVAVLLITALISQRRRRSAELASERRLSLVSTDLFSGPPSAGAADGENEYAEVHLYDRVRPMSVLPGESTFKPVRKQPTPVTPPETRLDEAPVSEGSVPVSNDYMPVFEHSAGSVPAANDSVPAANDSVPEADSVPAFEGMPEAQETPKTRKDSVEPLPPPPEDI